MSKDNVRENKSKIGGQALIEGIMMLGANKGAMACRVPYATPRELKSKSKKTDVRQFSKRQRTVKGFRKLPADRIDLEVWDENNGKGAKWYRKVPFVRGPFNFVMSMAKGYKYMMKSADKQMTEDEKGTVTDIFMYLGMIIGIAMAVGMFFVLPKYIIGFVNPVKEQIMLRSLMEGIVKISVFVLFMALTSLMKDMKRTYQYHGAEHKTIACHEARLPLTVKNVRKQTRLHKRCGTSFIFIVLFVGIIVSCFIPFTVWWQRAVTSIILLPVMVSISYELIRLAGTYDNFFTKILSAPGLALQKITTKEPDDSQIEIAIAAITPCIPEDLEDDVW